VTGVEEADLVELVGSHRFVPRRSFRHVGFDVRPDFVRRQMEPLRDPERRVVIEAGGRPVAAVGITPREFEAEVLGVGSVAATPVFTAPGLDRAELVAEVLAELRRWHGERGGQLVNLHVDTEDTGALRGAQDAGFRVCDTNTAWVMTPVERLAPDDLHVDGYRVVVLDGADATQLPRTATERLIAEAATEFVNTHLHADGRIPSDRSAEVYRRWGENTIYGGWYDRVITVWSSEDEVAGVLGWRILDLDGADGPVRVMTDSFGWRLASAPGVGKAFHRAVFGAFDVDICEGVTQLSNQLLYVLARGGRFRSILSFYAMHGWCD